MKRSLLALAVVALLAVSACANGEEEADANDVPAAAPTTPAPAPGDTILTTTTDSVHRPPAASTTHN
jgi:hypothetical protein